ncbi:hypothetical protein AB6H14_20155 [Providencia vermicola]
MERLYEPKPTFLDDKGNELNDVKLSAIQERFNGVLYFDILSQGKIPPVTSTGSRFLAFNGSIFCTDDFDVNGVQPIPIINRDSHLKYILMHVFNYIDCVDWEHSKVDHWPVGYIPETWESKRGRFLLNLLFIKVRYLKT